MKYNKLRSMIPRMLAMCLVALAITPALYYFSYSPRTYGQSLPDTKVIIPDVDFDESMQTSRYAALLHKNSLMPKFNFFKTLYTAHRPSAMPVSTKPLIPKKIHQIWLGGPLPKQYKSWQHTWRYYHPDWEYTLWTDKDVEAFKLKNKKYFDQAKNYGEKSDIWRYEIIERHGGLYADMDFECYQSFDSLHHRYDFYAGLEPLDVSDLCVGNSLIGAVPHHPLLQEAVNRIPQQYLNPQLNTFEKTGPIFLTNIITHQKMPALLKTAILPATYFFPLELTTRVHDSKYWKTLFLEASENPSWKKPESCAVHYYTSTWL